MACAKADDTVSSSAKSINIKRFSIISLFFLFYIFDKPNMQELDYFLMKRVKPSFSARSALYIEHAPSVALS